MTDAEIETWSKSRDWPLQFALEWRLDVTPLERHLLVWHECEGPECPHCGRCRFSIHGCNGNGPSRAEYLAWLSRR